MKNKCIKVKTCLIIWQVIQNNKKLFKKYKLSISDFHVIEMCLIELVDNGKTECIQESVMKMFKSFGFLIKEKGIGWSIK